MVTYMYMCIVHVGTCVYMYMYVIMHVNLNLIHVHVHVYFPTNPALVYVFAYTDRLRPCIYGLLQGGHSHQPCNLYAYFRENIVWAQMAYMYDEAFSGISVWYEGMSPRSCDLH